MSATGEIASEVRLPSTPGVLGYALSIVVSLAAASVIAGAFDVGDEGFAEGNVSVAVLVFLFGAIPAAVIGAVGAVVVHLCSRRVAAQWWHVAAAVLVGAGFGLALGFGDPWAAAWLGVSTGVGRLAVVPLVERRRRRALAAGPPVTN